MRKPFKGVINLDIRDSTPDGKPFLAQKAPECARPMCSSSSTTTRASQPSRASTGPGSNSPPVGSSTVVGDLADDAYVDVERYLEPAFARD